jgi:hypothetical protein
VQNKNMTPRRQIKEFSAAIPKHCLSAIRQYCVGLPQQ